MTVRDGYSPEELSSIVFDEELYPNQIKKLLYTKILTDFQFDVDGEKVNVHKAILAARCDAFHEVFSSGDEDKLKEMATITDVPLKVFKKFITYLYSGKLPYDSFDHAAHLLALAEKFGVADLIEKYGEVLKNHLTDSTAVAVFELANRYNMNHGLVVRAFKFIQK